MKISKKVDYRKLDFQKCRNVENAKYFNYYDFALFAKVKREHLYGRKLTLSISLHLREIDFDTMCIRDLGPI